MTVTNDKPTGFFVPIPVALESVLARLDVLSRQPEFAVQRDVALARAEVPARVHERPGAVHRSAPLVALHLHERLAARASRAAPSARASV